MTDPDTGEEPVTIPEQPEPVTIHDANVYPPPAPTVTDDSIIGWPLGTI